MVRDNSHQHCLGISHYPIVMTASSPQSGHVLCPDGLLATGLHGRIQVLCLLDSQPI